MKTIDIILPVYAGLDELRRCLESLFAHPQQTPWQLVLINDATPLPEIDQWLATFTADHPEIDYLRNERNLGFVASVNRGMARNPQHDVILLNSDTELHGDWLDRLRHCAAANPRAATLTPFSNNATICSFPRLCHDNPLPPGFPLAAIDRACAVANAGQSVEIPTGVGFCLYLRRRALDQLGLFDVERFGRGYGEENDFCRRAAAAGWSNLLCCDTFVYHSGGVSFAAEQVARASNAQEILDRLYPDYHHLVHQHIAADPQARHRLAAWIELLRNSPRPRSLHLTHHLSGGTWLHIQELFDHLANEVDFLLLKPLGEGRFELDLSGHQRLMLLQLRLPEQFPLLIELLTSIGLSHLHFHHTLGLETALWGLPARLGIPFDVTLHDYYFINANPTQTDDLGRYCPDLEQQATPYPFPVSLEQWQENQKPLLYQADRVIAPSHHTAALYRQHFPEARYRVIFHPEWERWAPYPAVREPQLPPDAPLRIVVFGAISREKGADLLEQSAQQARAQHLPLEFHLIGYAYRPLDAVIEHGDYDHTQIVTQIQQLDPHLLWFTALWPETYSYTLSEGLATGLPILAPNLGAFPERLAGRPFTWIEPWEQPVTAWLERLTQLRQHFIEQHSGTSHPWQEQPSTSNGDPFYRLHYLHTTPPATPGPRLDHTMLQLFVSESQHGSEQLARLSRRENLLRQLVQLRTSRPGRWLSRLIPLRLQRLLKRRLSHRPIHEVLRDDR